MIGNISKKHMNYIIKQLLEYDQTDTFPTALIKELNESKVLLDNARYLYNEGYIKMHFASNSVFHISITTEGRSYFFAKRQNLIKNILHWTINLSVAVLSAVAGSVLTLIIQHALFK